MKEWLLIDGYNVINHWQEFNKIREENLEHARELLRAMVIEYGVYKGQQVILVFDALEVQGVAKEEVVGGCTVVFTAEGETADSWIERKVYSLVNAGTDVYVVTSDFAEQMSILGSGAYRISAREFRDNYLIVKKYIAEHSARIKGKTSRNELGNNLKGDILEQFEILRRKR